MQTPPAIDYPDSDGQPVADNTVQFEWINRVFNNLAWLFRDAPDVFVAANNLIYPAEGDPKTRLAPDVYVALGRPKGHRGSYQVWNEGNTFPQVVWEVLSPGNTRQEMRDKRDSYERFGAEEYFVIDPDRVTAEVWVRRGGGLVQVPADGFVSPLLGVRLFRGPDAWELTLPDGRPFEAPVDTHARADAAETRADTAERQAVAEQARADQEQARADEAQSLAADAQVVADEALTRERLAQARADREQARADAAATLAAEERARADASSASESRAQAEADRLRAILKAAGLDPGGAS